MDYRQIPHYANSDLSTFENFIFNRKDYKSQKALDLGRIVHQHILEPGTVKGPEPGVDMVMVGNMVRAARADAFLSWIVQFSQKEQVRLWESEDGLPLKSKLDGAYKMRWVSDLKTTSARSREEFLRSCQRYNYDRQAAFYLDAIGAPAASRPRITFLAIQKIEPFAVWRFDYDTGDDFIESGRRKYRFLLAELARRQRQGIPFVPSSWAKPAPDGLVSSPQILTAA